MRPQIKYACALLLAGAAMFTAGEAVGSILEKAPAPTITPEPVFSAGCAVEDAAFVLRDFGGYVGVYLPDGSSPLTVTDISTGELRSADRELVGRGLPVADKEELLTLLEDLGS